MVLTNQGLTFMQPGHMSKDRKQYIVIRYVPLLTRFVAVEGWKCKLNKEFPMYILPPIVIVYVFNEAGHPLFAR